MNDTCTLCTLGDPPGCDACLGAAREPIGAPALIVNRYAA